MKKGNDKELNRRIGIRMLKKVVGTIENICEAKNISPKEK